MSDTYMDLGERLEEAYADIENDIVIDLRENSEECKALFEQLAELKKKNPIIRKLLETDGELHISAEERAVLREAYRLQHKLEDMERQQIYFRGHTDAVAYLKKIGAI